MCERLLASYTVLGLLHWKTVHCPPESELHVLCDPAILFRGARLRQMAAHVWHAQDICDTFTKAQPGNTPHAHQKQHEQLLPIRYFKEKPISPESFHKA